MPDPTTHPNIDLVVRYYEALNARRLDHYDELFDPDVHFTSVGGVEGTGVDLVKFFDQVWLTASSDFTITGLFHVADGDRVVCHNHARGVHDGTLLMPDGTEVPATGAMLDGPYFASFVIRDGKIVDEQIYIDRMMIAEALGLVPQPAAAEV